VGSRTRDAALGSEEPRKCAPSRIIIFDETVFERLRDVDIVVFDKTGTLTTGDGG